MGAQQHICWSVEGQAGSGQIELLFSPGQFLWRDENSGKYYMLSTWNHRNTGTALKADGEILKAKFVRRLLYYRFGVVEIAKHARPRCNKNMWG